MMQYISSCRLLHIIFLYYVLSGYVSLNIL